MAYLPEAMKSWRFAMPKFSFKFEGTRTRSWQALGLDFAGRGCKAGGREGC